MVVESTEQLYKDYIKSNDNKWEFANGILYNLCKDYPKHDDDHVIVAKLWLIGRSYAAAIERRPNSTIISDKFYYDIVARTINPPDNDKFIDNDKTIESIGAKLDKSISNINMCRGSIEDNLETILGTHKLLMDTFQKITGLNKRSLASKYLHFHCPDYFFLYDSRACSSINKYVIKPYKKYPVGENYDPEYKNYYCRMLELQEFLKNKNLKDVTPRNLDSFLLKKANEESDNC